MRVSKLILGIATILLLGSIIVGSCSPIPANATGSSKDIQKGETGLVVYSPEMARDTTLAYLRVTTLLYQHRMLVGIEKIFRQKMPLQPIIFSIHSKTGWCPLYLLR